MENLLKEYLDENNEINFFKFSSYEMAEIMLCSFFKIHNRNLYKNTSSFVLQGKLCVLNTLDHIIYSLNISKNNKDIPYWEDVKKILLETNFTNKDLYKFEQIEYKN
jgi:hypothetical protein